MSDTHDIVMAADTAGQAPVSPQPAGSVHESKDNNEVELQVGTTADVAIEVGSSEADDQDIPPDAPEDNEDQEDRLEKLRDTRRRAAGIYLTMNADEEGISEFVGLLGAAGVVFEPPAPPMKEVHGFDRLVKYVEHECELPDDLTGMSLRVVEAARREYAELRDPLLAWRSEDRLHGLLGRLLRSVLVPGVTCGSRLDTSRSALYLYGLESLCPSTSDLYMGIRQRDIVMAYDKEDEWPLEEANYALALRCGVLPTVTGVALNPDWFHFLFVDAKSGPARSGTLRVLSSMRLALALALQLHKRAARAAPNDVMDIHEMGSVYGLVTAGPSWEVHCMRVELHPGHAVHPVLYKTERIWEGHVDRASSLLQFLALMRWIAMFSDNRREIIGNWLWCLSDPDTDVADKRMPRVGVQKRRGSPIPAPAPKRNRQAVAVADEEQDMPQPVPVRQPSPVPAPVATPAEASTTPKVAPPAPPAQTPAPAPTPPPVQPRNLANAQWADKQERIGHWRANVADPSPAKLAESNADL